MNDLFYQEFQPQRILKVGEEQRRGFCYYRYEDGDGVIYLACYPILRQTEKGVWIDNYGQEKFVLNNDRPGRRWAYADERDAANSYKRRKEWQIKHAKRTIERATALLQLAEELL